MPRSTMKPRIRPSSVLAQTMAMSAIGELVIHILAPLSRKPPSTGDRARDHAAGIRAVVRLGQAEAADQLAGRETWAASAVSAPRMP